MTWTSYDIILSLMCWKLIMETSLQFGGSICLPRVRLSQPLRGFWPSLYGSAWDGWPFGSCHCCGQLSRSLFRGGRNGVLGVWHVERMTFFYQTKTKMPKVFKGLIDYIYIYKYMYYIGSCMMSRLGTCQHDCSWALSVYLFVLCSSWRGSG